MISPFRIGTFPVSLRVRLADGTQYDDELTDLRAVLARLPWVNPVEGRSAESRDIIAKFKKGAPDPLLENPYVLTQVITATVFFAPMTVSETLRKPSGAIVHPG